jgi:hypothetical protein
MLQSDEHVALAAQLSTYWTDVANETGETEWTPGR